MYADVAEDSILLRYDAHYYVESFTVIRRLTTFWSTDCIYDSGPIILYYDSYHCVTIAYSIQYSNMLYRFVA